MQLGAVLGDPGSGGRAQWRLAGWSPWAVIGAGGAGWPPAPQLSASGHGPGRGAERRRASLWVGRALGEAGQGAAGRAGPRRPPSAPAGAPGPAAGPRPAWTGRGARGAPGLLAPRPRPAARSPPARCLLQSRDRSQSQRRAQPTRPGASAWQGKARQGTSDNGDRPMGSLQGRGGVAPPRFRVGCTVCAPRRSLEGSAGAS